MTKKTYCCAAMHSETGRHYEEKIAESSIFEAIFSFDRILQEKYAVLFCDLSELDITELG